MVVAAKPIDSASPSSYEFTQAFYYAIFSACLYFFVATVMMVTVVGYYKGHYNREFNLTVSERTLMLQTIGFLFYLLCGAGVYARIEGWEYLDAVYWADYTLLTVGIGDIVPKTDIGRILLFPFAIGGITILGLIVCSVRKFSPRARKVDTETPHDRKAATTSSEENSEAKQDKPLPYRAPTI
jgi:potassium channel subfamily K, other eukaryote